MAIYICKAIGSNGKIIEFTASLSTPSTSLASRGKLNRIAFSILDCKVQKLSYVTLSSVKAKSFRIYKYASSFKMVESKVKGVYGDYATICRSGGGYFHNYFPLVVDKAA